MKAAQPVGKTGLYRLRQGSGDAKQDVLVMVGPTDAPEFGDMHATDEKTFALRKNRPAAEFSGWRINRMVPEIKRTGLTGSQSGWDWLASGATSNIT